MKIQRREKKLFQEKRKEQHYKTTFDYKNNSLNRAVYLTQVSRNSRAILNNLIASMNSSYNDMTIKYNKDEKIGENLSKIIFEKSRRLGRELKRLTRINDKYNAQFNENFSDKNENSFLTNQKSKKNTGKSNYSEVKKNITEVNSDSKSKIFGFDSENNSEDSLDNINKEKEKQLFLKTNKINIQLKKYEILSKLKGEILMNEQKKKCSLKKDPIHIIPDIPYGLFYRDIPKNYSFQPFKIYNKTKLYLNKNKNLTENNTLNEENDSISGKKSNLKNNDYINLKSKSAMKEKFKFKRKFSKNRITTINTTVDESSKLSSDQELFLTNYNGLLKSEKKVQFLKEIPIPKFNKTSYQNKNNQKKNLSRKKLFIQSVKNITKIQNKIFETGKEVNKYFKRISTPNIKKKKIKINLEEIEDDIKKNYIENEGNERNLLKQNAKKVEKVLDNSGKKILWNIVNEVIYEDNRLDKEFEIKTLWERRLQHKRQNQEFKLISLETSELEKKLNLNKIIVNPNDEKKKINKVIKTVFDYNYEDEKSLNQMLYKAKVLKFPNHQITKNKYCFVYK